MSHAESASERGRGKARSTTTRERNLEIANEKPDDVFVSDYLRPSDDWSRWVHPSTDERYTLRLQAVAHLTNAELDTCYDLIEKTSGEDYRSSAGGWHPAAKKKEMRSPGLRYILVEEVKAEDISARPDDAPARIRGFMSIMPTFEFGDSVVYVYEVHLEEELQGTGLGRLLMEHAKVMAGNIPGVEKVMLTCFVSNRRARRFYEKMGFEVDESSPGDRKLRGGKIVTSDYVILSHSTKNRKRAVQPFEA